MRTLLVSLALALTPAVALAAVRTFKDIVDTIVRLINLAIPVIIAAGLLAFLWGIALYLAAGVDGERKENARRFMIWGVVAIFVMVTFFALAEALKRTFFG